MGASHEWTWHGRSLGLAHQVDVASLGVMGCCWSSVFSYFRVFRGIGFEAGSAVIALVTFCVRKTWFLVMSLTVSSAAPPILALLSIPTEFKMVSF